MVPRETRPSERLGTCTTSQPTIDCIGTLSAGWINVGLLRKREVVREVVYISQSPYNSPKTGL
jgi:hypothetical protein